MKIKKYSLEIMVVASVLLVLLALSKTSPTTAVSPTTKYVPPDVIDPKILLDDPSVQKRTKMVRGKKEPRGFGMGLQMRSNFWVDNEEISLVEYAADYADTFVTLYGSGKPEVKLQSVEILSWGSSPIVTFEALRNTDLAYVTRLSSSHLLVYPEVESESQFETYCTFFKEYLEEYSTQKLFGPVLSYEYFSGKLDNRPKWDVVDDSCFDFIALSSYPTRIYNSIEKLPEGYYGDVVDAFPNSEIIFADVGWSATASSKEDQSLFLEYLYSFAKDNQSVEFIIYGHLFDPFDDALYYHKGAGLVSSDEVAKPALATWKRLFDLGEEK